MCQGLLMRVRTRISIPCNLVNSLPFTRSGALIRAILNHFQQSQGPITSPQLLMCRSTGRGVCDSGINACDETLLGQAGTFNGVIPSIPPLIPHRSTKCSKPSTNKNENHNALAMTILHGNTLGDQKTIPSRVSSSFPCTCLHRLTCVGVCVLLLCDIQRKQVADYFQ